MAEELAAFKALNARGHSMTLVAPPPWLLIITLASYHHQAPLSISPSSLAIGHPSAVASLHRPLSLTVGGRYTGERVLLREEATDRAGHDGTHRPAAGGGRAAVVRSFHYCYYFLTLHNVIAASRAPSRGCSSWCVSVCVCVCCLFILCLSLYML